MISLPHSSDAEIAVLASMMLSPKTVIAECASKIQPDYFSIPANRTIYDTMVDMWSKAEPIDLVTVSQAMRNNHTLEQVGGAQYITSVFLFIPTAANVEYYIGTLQDKYLQRRLIAEAQACLRKAPEECDDVAALVAETQERFSSITTKQVSERKSIGTLVQEKMERMERGEQGADIVKTGIAWLDYKSPLRNKDMPVISGERKSGKTMLALTIAKNVAATGIPVAFMSLESSDSEAVDRLLSGISRIPMSRQDHVKSLNEEELKHCALAGGTLSALPIYLYDDIFDLHHIIAEARRLRTQRKIGLLIVDYLQLVRVPSQKDRNREQEVASISRALRLLALELRIPIIALSQLNEEGRSRESRAIEQDTTAMWKFEQDNPPSPHLRRICVPFQRNGESNTHCQVTFLGEIARIENYAAPDNQHD
jgi:replicative DNA helicase